jgi:outer membrane protein insertion porin family
MRLLRTSLTAALSLSPAALAAQQYTAARVQFSQMGTFTQAQLEDAAGVHAGASLTAADLGAAAQRLVDTGYFDDMSATIDGKVTAATIKFEDKPTPLDHMPHVGFENFLWLTHDEIEAAIKTKIPLFSGYLLDNSPHLDDLKAALTAALAAKSVPAQVACEDFEPTLEHPRLEVACRIARPSIRVVNIKLAGVTPTLAPLVQKSVNATARTAYTEGPANQTTAERILAPLLDAGYVEAKLTDASPTPSPVDNGTVAVVLAATLQPGEIFHVSGIIFGGSPFLSADAFAATAKLHAGDVASRKALLETLAPLDAAYRRKGYMDIVIDAVPTLDETAHQVAFAVTFQPGEQYRVHEITANNLDPAAKADFDRGFLMKAGELYNPEYVAGFLKANTALPALAGYSATFKAYADPNTHLVDVVITFAKGGSFTPHP